MFLGFDVIPQPAEKTKIPPRQIGRLVVIAVMLATLWYVGTAKMLIAGGIAGILTSWNSVRLSDGIAAQDG